MMITVRDLKTGRAVTYNHAMYVERLADGVRGLYEKSGYKGWVASIQPTAGVIIEGEAPCAIHEPVDRIEQGLNDFSARLRWIERRLLELTPKKRTKKRR